MNAPKVVAGLAVLVLAGFWAVVLILFLTTIGYLIVLVAPFVTLLAVGFYAIIDGMGGSSARSKGGNRSRSKVGALSLTVLQMTAQGKSQQEIAAATSVSPFIIGKKVERLNKLGYLYENALSEKGFDALKEPE